ncbi:MAG: DUF4232 domain-containing protein [Marmoricola sp.]
MSNPARAAAAVVAIVAVTVGVSGCGTSGQGPSAGRQSATAGPTPGSSASTHATPATGTSGSASSSPSRPAHGAAHRGCLTADLAFHVKTLGGAAGSVYSRIVMTNRGSAPCVTGGYGGVSFVGDHGNQLGVAAERDRSVPVRRIVLRPGESAVARLQVSEALNYPRRTCHPVRARGLRIYPPNETHAAVVRHPETACRSHGVSLMTLRPYRERR